MATAKLTRDTVRKLELPAGQREAWLWDTHTRGLAVRATKGRKSWVVRYKSSDGRWQRAVLGATDELGIETARARAVEVKEAARSAPNAAATLTPQAPTFGEVGRQWLEFLDREIEAGNARPNTVKGHRRYFERELVPLHDVPIDEITAQLVARVTGSLADAGHPATANRCTSTAQSLTRYAKRRGLIATRPLLGAEKEDEHTRPRRILAIDEARAVYEAARDGTRGGAAVRVVALTGLRRSEVGGMVPAEVDAEARAFRLPQPRSKSHAPLTVPLVGDAWDIIAGRLAVGGDTLFGQDGKPFSGWQRVVSRIVRKADVGHWTLHDLRATFSTLSNEHRLAPPDIVSAQLNHKSGPASARAGVDGTYNHAEVVEFRRQLLAAWHEMLTGRVPDH